MINLRFIIDKTYKSKVGTYPILLELFENTSHIRIPTGISVMLKEWKGGKDPYDLTKNAEYNRMLGELHTKYMYRLRMLEADGKVENQTITQVRDMLTGSSRKRQTFFEHMDSHIALVSKSTSTFFEWTKKQLLEFNNGKEPAWESINHSFLVNFDKWMEKKGNKINTRSIHLRNIRTIFNSAIADDIIPADMYPFRKLKIQNAKKEKTILTPSQLRSIMKLEIPDNMPTLELTRDMFMLSFFMAGMNPVDIFNLKCSDYDDGFFVFQRQKIKFREPEPTHLFLTIIAGRIMDSYRIYGDEHAIGMSKRYANYQNFYDNIKKRIKIIGKYVGIPELTMYHARYTWASIASQIGVDEAVIGKALGHTPTSLAGKRYVTFDWDRVANAQRAVEAFVLDPKNE